VHVVVVNWAIKELTPSTRTILQTFPSHQKNHALELKRHPATGGFGQASIAIR
jgi:hypothetical protein